MNDIIPHFVGTMIGRIPAILYVIWQTEKNFRDEAVKHGKAETQMERQHAEDVEKMAELEKDRERLLNAIQGFRNLTTLGAFTKLRSTFAYVELCNAWKDITDDSAIQQKEKE